MIKISFGMDINIYLMILESVLIIPKMEQPSPVFLLIKMQENINSIMPLNISIYSTKVIPQEESIQSNVIFSA